MGNPCPGVGLGIGFIALIGIIYTLASKEWRVSSSTSSSNVVMDIHSYEGLWVRCTSPQSGQITCDHYDESKFLLPGMKESNSNCIYHRVQILILAVPHCIMFLFDGRN